MIHRVTPWLGLCLATIIAIALRFPYLDLLPPGLNFDEGGEGIAALDVAQGIFKVMWPIGGGKEPLMAYLVQPLFWLFGPTRLALRLYTALWGVAAVLATFFFARYLWLSDEDEARHTWIPIFAALGLATAFWHVAYSRIAFRALSNPAVEALALGFLWRAFYTQRWRDFLIAGFFLGGLIYTYLAGRFVPIAVGLFLIVQLGLVWLAKKSLFLRTLNALAAATPYLQHYWWKLVSMASVALLIFLPMGIFFIQNPGAFSERAAAVSIFSPTMNQGDFWGTLWQTTGTTLGTFFSLTGDPNPLGNIPGRPELNSLLAIFFVIGILVTVWQWYKPTHLFLLIWWPIMLLPAILAPEDTPHHLRLIGTAPGTYIFVGLGVYQLLSWIVSIVNRQWSIANDYAMLIGGWLLAVLTFGFIGYQTYHDYFFRWANEIDHYMAFDLYAEELAQQMASDAEQQVAYAIPMDLRAAHEARHYSLDFLYAGLVPYHYILVDEATVAQTLTKAATGKARLKVVRWIADKHQEADTKELVTFLLTTGDATLIDYRRYPAYHLEIYQLPTRETQFALPKIETPLDVTLDQLIQIRRAVILPTPTASEQVAVGVTYARIAPTKINYKASLRLIDPKGTLVAQTDRMLRHNWHQGTSLWPAEEVNEYYLLSLPIETIAGLYTVRLVVYDPETLAPLTKDGLVEVPLGTLPIER